MEVAQNSLQCLFQAIVGLGKAEPEVLFVTRSEGVTRCHTYVLLSQQAFAEFKLERSPGTFGKA